MAHHFQLGTGKTVIRSLWARGAIDEPEARPAVRLRNVSQPLCGMADLHRVPHQSTPPWQSQKCTPLVKEIMPVRHRPGDPFSNDASVAQRSRAPGFEPEGCRFESYRKRHKIYCSRSSMEQSTGFLPQRLQVRILPGVPCISCPRSPMQRRRSQKPEVAGANPAVGTTFRGVLAGQACRCRLLSDQL